VTEHLHNVLGCKTIFATHYHELTQLAEELPAVRNYTVAVREVGEQVLFLHRLEAGAADRSYGIEVGRLAGLPRPILDRAREVLRLLEAEHHLMGSRRPVTEAAAAAEQIGLFPQSHHIVDRLRQIDVNTLTPLQSLDELARLVDEARTT
jgi:DNA mismatch repair protein MutS